MRKSKANFAGVTIVLMLLVLDGMLAKVFPLGFFTLTGAFALYGAGRFTVDFCRWLGKDRERECNERIVLPFAEMGQREDAGQSEEVSTYEADGLDEILHEYDMGAAV